MPGTGDLTYVLGPSVVAVALGALLLVAIRVVRRGPAVTPRSAPDHGLPQPATEASDAGDITPLLRALRRAGVRCTVTEAADEQRVLVRPSDAHARKELSRR